MVSPGQRFREQTELWNAGRFEEFMDGFAPDVEFVPDPTWPEQGPFIGLGAVRRFMVEYRDAWAQVDLEIDDVSEREGYAVGRGRWIVRGVASGADVPVGVTIVVRLNEHGLISEMRGFFEHADALAWVDARTAEAHRGAR